jgi:hypothetical protein
MRKNITRDGILSTQVLSRWQEDVGPDWIKEVQEETKPSRINQRHTKGHDRRDKRFDREDLED